MSSTLKPGALTALAAPRDDDSALTLDVKRRLASDALAAGDQGAWSEAIEVLRALAHSAESDKVRAMAAKDLLRFGVSIAFAPESKRRSTDADAALTAGALLASVDPARLREVAAAVRDMKARGVLRRSVGDARIVDVSPEPAPGGGEGGSDHPAGPGGRGTPLASVTVSQDRPGAVGVPPVDPTIPAEPDPPPPPGPPPPLDVEGLPSFVEGTIGHGRGNPRGGDGACPW